MGAKKGKFKMCDFCKEKTIENYTVYKLSWLTNKSSYDMGLKSLFDQLGDFLSKKGSHLSASQIVLMRPDILKEFLQREKCSSGEFVGDFFLSEYLICNNCYVEYTKIIPLI